MTQVKSEKRTSFIVRFIGEVSNDHGEWRGQVEHVQSGEKRPFRGAQQLLWLMQDLCHQDEERR